MVEIDATYLLLRRGFGVFWIEAVVGGKDENLDLSEGAV